MHRRHRRTSQFAGTDHGPAVDDEAIKLKRCRGNAQNWSRPRPLRFGVIAGESFKLGNDLHAAFVDIRGGGCGERGEHSLTDRRC